MALNSLERLMVQLGLDYSEFKKGRAGVGVESKGMADDVRQNMAKAGQGVGAFASGAVTSLAAPLAAFASVSVVVGQLRQSIDRLDAVSDRVERLGVGAEKLQELSYYAEFSSVSVETLDGSIRVLSKNMAAAASGNKEQAGLFKALGVQVVDANGKMRGADDVMRDLAGRFAGMEDGAGKTAWAMKLFGDAGSNLLPMLNGGVDGMDKAAAKARELGLVMGEDVVANAAKFNDSLDDLSRNGQGAFNNLAAVVLPTLIQFTEKILAATKGVKDFYAEARNAGGVAAFFDDKLFGSEDPDVAIGKATAKIADAEKKLGELRNRSQRMRDFTRYDWLFFGGEEAQYEEVLRRQKGMLTAAQARKAALAPKPVALLPVVEVTEKAPPPPLPTTGTATESEGAKYLKQIRERGAALLAESQSTDKLSQSQKDLATFEQRLISAKDGSFKANERAIRSQLDANIAAEKEIELRDKQIKADEALASFRDTLGQSEQGLLAGLAETSAAFGKSAEQRKIAAASSKIMRDADKLIADQMRAGAPLTFDYVASVYSLANAQAEVTRELMGRQQAEEGAQQLYAENQRFGLEYIADEQQRAAKVLEIDAAAWQARIDLAKEGSAERQRLEELFGIWYANQLSRPALEMQQKIQQSTTNGWIGVVDGAGDVFRDGMASMLQEGQGTVKAWMKSTGTSAKTAIADSLYQAFAKPFVVQVVANLAGLLTGSASVAQGVLKASGGGSSLLGTASNGLSLGNSLMGGSGSMFSALGSSSLLGTTGVGAGLQYVGANGILGGLTSAPTFLAAGEFGLAAGAALPALSAALAAYSLLSGSFKGETRSGGTFNYQDGQAAFVHGPSGGTAGQEGVVTSAMTATADGVNSILKGVGSALSVSSLIAGFEGSEKGRGGVMSGITLSNGRTVGEDGSGSNYKGTYYEKNSPQTLTTEAAAALLATDLKQVQIQALQAAEDLPAALKKLVDGIEAESLSDDAVTSLLAKIQAQVNGVTQFTAFVDGFEGPFDKLKGLTYDLKASLIEAAGGAEPLTANLASYYENFTSEADRMSNTFNAMKKTVEGVGQVMPTTEAEFKSLADGLINGLSETDVEGQKALATVLGLNGTFKSWADYTKAAADAERDRLQKISDGQKEALQVTRDAWDEYLSYLSDETAAARDGVQEAYDREADALRNTISATEAYIDSLASLRRGLLLGDLSTLSPEQKYAQGKADLDALIARAEGGDEKARGEVPQAIQQFLELSRSYNASSEAYQRDFQEYLNTAERLRTSAVSQLDISRSQLAKLDTMVEGILDVKKAVLSLPDALAVFLKAQATQAKPGTMPTTPAGLTDIEKAINDAYIASDGRNADAAGLAFWREAIANGANKDAIIEQIKAINKANEYDGSHADGLAFVPKDGYRARLHFGERVLTAADNRDYSAPRYGSSSMGSDADAVIQAFNRGWAQVAQEVRVWGRANLDQRAATHGEVRQLQRAQLDVRQQERASV